MSSSVLCRRRGHLHFSKMGARNHYSHFCAALAALYFQSAAELLHSFSHSYDPHSHPFARGVTSQHSLGYTAPLIGYRNSQSLWDLLELDPGLVAAGMQMNMCKAGLHDPEDREFRFSG